MSDPSDTPIWDHMDGDQHMVMWHRHWQSAIEDFHGDWITLVSEAWVAIHNKEEGKS